MNKELARSLVLKIEDVRDKFSSPTREFNYSKEVFMIERLIPLSETTAAVVYGKSSGKQALAFFYFISSRDGGYWQYFFPKESHIVGMQRIDALLHGVEMHNIKYNFKHYEMAYLYSQDVDHTHVSPSIQKGINTPTESAGVTVKPGEMEEVSETENSGETEMFDSVPTFGTPSQLTEQHHR